MKKEELQKLAKQMMTLDDVLVMDKIPAKVRSNMGIVYYVLLAVAVISFVVNVNSFAGFLVGLIVTAVSAVLIRLLCEMIKFSDAPVAKPEPKAEKKSGK